MSKLTGALPLAPYSLPAHMRRETIEELLLFLGSRNWIIVRVARVAALVPISSVPGAPSLLQSCQGWSGCIYVRAWQSPRFREVLAKGRCVLRVPTEALRLQLSWFWLFSGRQERVLNLQGVLAAVVFLNFDPGPLQRKQLRGAHFPNWRGGFAHGGSQRGCRVTWLLLWLEWSALTSEGPFISYQCFCFFLIPSWMQKDSWELLAPSESGGDRRERVGEPRAVRVAVPVTALIWLCLRRPLFRSVRSPDRGYFAVAQSFQV